MKQGQTLYDSMSHLVLNEYSVSLDFEGVEIVATPFFNASISMLLRDIPIDECKNRVNVKNLHANGRRLLNVSIANAINHFNNKAQ